MNRKSFRPYLLIFAFLLLVLSIPLAVSNKAREQTISYLGTFWNAVTPGIDSDKISSIHKLQIENQLLRNELFRLKTLLSNEKILDSEHAMLMSQGLDSSLKLHQKILRKQLGIKYKAMPAKVIFRFPSTWGSSLWVNVGSDNNKNLNVPILEKNSPVLVGNSIIGVIDYVGKNQSRVKLITDSGLTPSVRAVRGGFQHAVYLDFLNYLANFLETNDSISQETIEQLNSLKKALQPLISAKTQYLAKGELHGCSCPLWRSRGSLLRGIGFNYDFDDEHGPARDLRSGAPLGTQASKENSMPLLQVDDILVTTGMDGVFPEGFQVAKVTKIETLKEGDYFYEIEAYPTAGNLNEITTVYVIPPLGYDSDDQPPLIGQE